MSHTVRARDAEPLATQTHWPALDGVRPVAILLVMAVHTQLPPMSKAESWAWTFSLCFRAF